MKLSKWIESKKNDKKYGKYPCCEYINNALRFLMKKVSPSDMDDTYKYVMQEIVDGIICADGYFYKDVGIELAKRGVIVPIHRIHGIKVTDLKED